MPEETANEATKEGPIRVPQVFISHDSADAQLAEAFAGLIRNCTGGIAKTFRSSDQAGSSGIPFGDEWFKWIMGKLSQSTDVVALLTPRSMDRPWILYEVGVAKGMMKKTVFGIVFGMPLASLGKGPFMHWQNCESEEKPLVKLVRQLIQQFPGADPSDQALRDNVQRFLKDIKDLDFGLGEKETIAAPPSPEVAAVADYSQKMVAIVAKYFEEIKAMLRTSRPPEPETSAERFVRNTVVELVYPLALSAVVAVRKMDKHSWIEAWSMLSREIPPLPNELIHRVDEVGDLLASGDRDTANEAVYRLIAQAQSFRLSPMQRDWVNYFEWEFRGAGR